MPRPERTAAAALAVGLVALGLTGCLSRLVPEPAPPPQSYDFGPLPDERPAALARRVRLASVEAPSWLDGRDIRYRRLDEHPLALHAYARSQWVAPVPELVAQRFDRRLERTAPAGGDADPLVLRLEIARFEQVFTGSDDAAVLLQARARLEDSNGGLHERILSLERPSAPNARGAATELSALIDAAVDDVLVWVGEDFAARDRP